MPGSSEVSIDGGDDLGEISTGGDLGAVGGGDLGEIDGGGELGAIEGGDLGAMGGGDLGAIDAGGDVGGVDVGEMGAGLGEGGELENLLRKRRSPHRSSSTNNKKSLSSPLKFQRESNHKHRSIHGSPRKNNGSDHRAQFPHQKSKSAASDAKGIAFVERDDIRQTRRVAILEARRAGSSSNTRHARFGLRTSKISKKRAEKAAAFLEKSYPSWSKYRRKSRNKRNSRNLMGTAAQSQHRKFINIVGRPIRQSNKSTNTFKFPEHSAYTAGRPITPSRKSARIAGRPSKQGNKSSNTFKRSRRQRRQSTYTVGRPVRQRRQSAYTVGKSVRQRRQSAYIVGRPVRQRRQSAYTVGRPVKPTRKSANSPGRLDNHDVLPDRDGYHNAWSMSHKLGGTIGRKDRRSATASLSRIKRSRKRREAVSNNCTGFQT